MKKIIKKILKLLIEIKKRIILPFKLKKIVNAGTYYPEFKRKNKLARYWDNIKWIYKYGEVNSFYTLYGMDVYRDIDIDSYVDNASFMLDRNCKNGIFNDYNYAVILRDKNLFEKYFSMHSINVVKTIAVIKDGEVFDSFQTKKMNEKDLFKKKDSVFIKAVAGECADGVYCVKNYNEYQKMKKIFNKGVYIVQNRVIQNEEMSKLNPKAINTLRIVTVRTKKGIEVLTQGVRVGTNKSNNVDNWAAGGFFVEIGNDGKLFKYGFYKPVYTGKADIHPDTGVKFEGFKIPYYKEAIELVKKAHEYLYGIHSIGWDVAITPTGPILIEGNDNYEISLMQSNHGLKKEWKESLK